MQQSDLDDVLAIERVSFAAPWSRDVFLKELANRAARSEVFTADDGAIVGYVCFWVVLDEAHIQTIAVHPNMRGRGYGSAIMGHVEEICLREGVRRIILEVGRRNTAARNLYRKCGFTAIGFRKRYYAEIDDDAVVMEKWLTSSAQVNSESGADLR
ncbi:MAG: ribosomal protein S18-alanine N-acetyltransferase [Desulfomonile sp.]|nr:ribosomal protein S18-alanine N-acetyltransferase [Desulfomonile sp.]